MATSNGEIDTSHFENQGGSMSIWLRFFLCEGIVFWGLFFISPMILWTNILWACVLALGFVLSVIFSKKGSRISAAFRHALALFVFAFISSMTIGVWSRESQRVDHICRNGLNEPILDDKKRCYEEAAGWIQRVYRLESCSKLRAEISMKPEPKSEQAQIDARDARD